MNIELDEYQAVNLLWLLVVINTCKIDHYLNTGDWVNEIRFILEDQFIRMPQIRGPNEKLSTQKNLNPDYEKYISALEKKILG